MRFFKLEEIHIVLCFAYSHYAVNEDIRNLCDSTMSAQSLALAT